jgi:hypothetical protein
MSNNPTERSFDLGYAFGRKYAKRAHVYISDLHSFIPSAEEDEGNPKEWIRGAYEGFTTRAR